MNPKLKSVLQYLVTIAITGVLVWLSLRGIKAGDGQDTADLIWSVWAKSNKIYLVLMAAILMTSHVFRAERWRMFARASGNRGTLTNSFLSVMVGYLVNLAIPARRRKYRVAIIFSSWRKLPSKFRLEQWW
ncbi:MAG: lysylphosphatidylglycerol synthase domain-containing protein [Bacteroidota bacterium]